MLSDYFEFEFQKDDWIYSMPPLIINFEKNVQEKHDSVMVQNTIPVMGHHQINLAVVQKKELRQDLVCINKKTEGKIQMWASQRGSKYVSNDLLFHLTYVKSSFPSVQQFK